MTVLLDAYAVIAYLRGEPAADDVAVLLKGPTVLAAVNAAEVVDQLVRVWNRELDDVLVALSLLNRSNMAITDATETTALQAGRLRSQYYDKRSCCVSMADCFAAATALAMDAALATSDPHLVLLMLQEGGRVHPLPDRQGRIPPMLH